jgi:4-azaleucine resistance transporter AzlC
MGLAVYAGAAQFMSVGLLAAGAGIGEIALTTLLLNARHSFYGLSLIPRFPRRGLQRLYLIFGLTDETYSLLTGVRPPPDHNPHHFFLAVTGLNQLYWVVGCTAGALLGAGGGMQVEGLDFTLTALFVVLTIEQALALREARPFAIAVASAAVAFAVAGSENMLLVGLGLATFALLADPRRREWARTST